LDLLNFNKISIFVISKIFLISFLGPQKLESKKINPKNIFFRPKSA
jgi:hypothetical protein